MKDPGWVSRELADKLKDRSLPVLDRAKFRMAGHQDTSDSFFVSPAVISRQTPQEVPVKSRLYNFTYCDWSGAHRHAKASKRETMLPNSIPTRQGSAWTAIVKEVRWHNFSEVRSMSTDADNVKGYVIFNIRQNRYRLVTVIHYARTDKTRRTQGHVNIRSDAQGIRQSGELG